MKIRIDAVSTMNQIDDYWTKQDYANLLKDFDYEDAESVNSSELEEMLFMAMTDYEPSEAAAVILKYKMSDKLNENQIQSISHEMIEDKVAEEYPEPEFHYDLFNINQLLYRAFNGTFPNTEATLLKFEVIENDGVDISSNKEILAKIIAGSLGDRSIIKRLFAGQLDGSEAFDDAHKFIWRISSTDNKNYEILTSRYWIEKEDIPSMEYEVSVNMHEED